MKLSEAFETFYNEKEKALKVYNCKQLENYKLTWNNRKSSFGLAYFSKPEIQLSRPLTLTHSTEHVTDTIRHEIAHVIAFFIYGDRGHGKYWKEVLLKLGNKEANRTGKAEVLLDRKWTLVYLDERNQLIKISMHSRKLKNLSSRYIKNNKKTLGRLYLVLTKDFKLYEANKLNISNINLYQD